MGFATAGRIRLGARLRVMVALSRWIFYVCVVHLRSIQSGVILVLAKVRHSMITIRQIADQIQSEDMVLTHSDARSMQGA